VNTYRATDKDACDRVALFIDHQWATGKVQAINMIRLPSFVKRAHRQARTSDGVRNHMPGIPSFPVVDNENHLLVGSSATDPLFALDTALFGGGSVEHPTTVMRFTIGGGVREFLVLVYMKTEPLQSASIEAHPS
jgi:hypothetical protein